MGAAVGRRWPHRHCRRGRGSGALDYIAVESGRRAACGRREMRVSREFRNHKLLGAIKIFICVFYWTHMLWTQAVDVDILRKAEESL